MEIPDDIDAFLLAKYVAGEATPAEIELTERWATADPRHAAELDAIRTGATRHRLTRRPETSTSIPRGPRRCRSALVMGGCTGGRRGPRVRRAPMRMVAKPASPLRRMRPWLAVALAAALPAGWRVVIERRAKLTQQASSDDRVYETREGERSRIELSDGTKIAMAAETRLRVSSRFGEGRRDVFLTGETLFDVVHDWTKPFAVHVGSLVAQDLGTQFGVRA